MLNQRIKELRKKLGLTQQEFADKIGSSKSYVSQVEQGSRGFTFETISLLNELFNVNLNWLSTGKGSMFVDQPEPEDTIVIRLKKGQQVKFEYID